MEARRGRDLAGARQGGKILGANLGKAEADYRTCAVAPPGFMPPLCRRVEIRLRSTEAAYGRRAIVRTLIV